MSAARDTYEERVRQKSQASNEAPVKSDAEAFKDSARSMGAQTATQSAQQGNLMGTVGGGLMMTGNPYAMAAGLGLQVFAAGEQNKRAAEEKQRQEYNARVARRQEMLANMANMRIE